MKKILFCFLFFHSLFVFAAPSVSSLPFNIDTEDYEALQRGARIYMNHCSGCHSLKYMRYNRMAFDLGLTRFDGKVDEDVLKSNLIFTQASIADPIQISMPEEESREWFGVVPPDLTLVARYRGPEWIYAFLQGFYEDPHRPFHSNNIIFPDVGMPDVLAPLRGTVVKDQDQHLVRLKPGRIDNASFDQQLKDLVFFLVYVSEPIRDERKKIGIGVVLFLSVLFGFLYSLNRLYWKKIKK